MPVLIGVRLIFENGVILAGVKGADVKKAFFNAGDKMLKKVYTQVVYNMQKKDVEKVVPLPHLPAPTRMAL